MSILYGLPALILGRSVSLTRLQTVLHYRPGGPPRPAPTATVELHLRVLVASPRQANSAGTFRLVKMAALDLQDLFWLEQVPF
jgi:hypothetical protein